MKTFSLHLGSSVIPLFLYHFGTNTVSLLLSPVTTLRYSLSPTDDNSVSSH